MMINTKVLSIENTLYFGKIFFLKKLFKPV